MSPPTKRIPYETGDPNKRDHSIPMHLQTRWMTLFGYKKGDFPISEKIKEQELGLPAPRFREYLEVENVAKAIKEFDATH